MSTEYPPLSYEVVYTRRRGSMAIRISREKGVRVFVPYGTKRQPIEAFVNRSRPSIEAALTRLPQPKPPLSEAEIAALRRRAETELPERVKHFAAFMGVRPSYVKITAAKKRFGSCNSRRGLCFSLYLMQYPPEAIDYVVVHELAHLRHPNHSPAFHGFVAEILPDAAARRALLRQAP
ncbi:MAG: M48 family metallopeptidase [Ruminococcaceae bacterium]|nr:M48 family metallopeptidase [Oscillospiraceae bacterium]